jgi:hypothetical protein
MAWTPEVLVGCGAMEPVTSPPPIPSVEQPASAADPTISPANAAILIAWPATRILIRRTQHSYSMGSTLGILGKDEFKAIAICSHRVWTRFSGR